MNKTNITLKEKFKKMEEKNKNSANVINSMLAFFCLILISFCMLAYSKGNVSLNENKEVLNILKYSKNYINYLNNKIKIDEIEKLENIIKSSDNNGSNNVEYLINTIKKIKNHNSEEISKNKISLLLTNIIDIINKNYMENNDISIRTYEEIISLIKVINEDEDKIINENKNKILKIETEKEKNKINNEIKLILKN